jgi:hypothetical protein
MTKINSIDLPGEEKGFIAAGCPVCGLPIESFFDWETMENKLRCTHPFLNHIIENGQRINN